MDRCLLEQLIKSVGIYFSITSNDGYSYSNIPSDFNKGEILTKYNDKYYDRKIGFVDISDVRYEIIIFNDVTDIKRKSMYDQKTGALTLDSFQRSVEKNISSGDDIILCLMDIDDFKGINDTFGHHVGDLVLSKVVEELKKILKEDAFICRFGGDEFLIGLKSNDIDYVRNIMDEFATIFKSNLIIYENVYMSISFSIGITKYKKDEDFDTNFKDVDSVMYYCKKNGKNAVVSKECYVKVLDK